MSASQAGLMIFQSLVCGCVMPVISHTVRTICFKKINFGNVLLESCPSPAWGTKLPGPWEPKSKAKSGRESTNAGSPPVLRSLVFPSKQPACLSKVTWDVTKLELQQESLFSACKSKDPYGTAHLCSKDRSCWPRRILFLAQSASAVRWDWGEGSMR